MTATLSSTTPAHFWVTNGTTVSATMSATSSGNWFSHPSASIIAAKYKAAAGRAVEIDLPDGAKLRVSADGSYTVEDEDAKIQYRANRFREFNRFVSGSDLLEAFMKHVAAVAPEIRSREMLGLPVELFIKWLVISAAEQDGDPVGELERQELSAALAAAASDRGQEEIRMLAPPEPERRAARCGACGRYVTARRRDLGVPFCDPTHASVYMTKIISRSGEARCSTP